jgi:hypothetical protein
LVTREGCPIFKRLAIQGFPAVEKFKKKLKEKFKEKFKKFKGHPYQFLKMLNLLPSKNLRVQLFSY